MTVREKLRWSERLLICICAVALAGEAVAMDPAGINAVKLRAEKGEPEAELALGILYSTGEGVIQDVSEAINWYRRAATHGNRVAQHNLGILYAEGKGVEKNLAESANWLRKSAEQGFPPAQIRLGLFYAEGQGVPRNHAEALGWIRRAAEQGDAEGQRVLGVEFAEGTIVRESYVEGYKWLLLAAAQGNSDAVEDRDNLAKKMSGPQIAEARRLATAFVPHADAGAAGLPKSSGTGFFISKNAHLITALHVVDGATRIVVKTRRARFVAQLVKADKTNDLALLRILGAFPPLTLTNRQIQASQEAALYQLPNSKLLQVVGDFTPLRIGDAAAVKLGDAAATFGYPNPDIQGMEPKFTRGEINSLAGVRDDGRYFQISTPVQPGNSGGPLLDARGNVIGVVVSRLNDVAVLQVTGQLPQNVNYAIKSTVLSAFLKSVPALKDRLESPVESVASTSSEEWLKEAEKSIAVVLAF
ncbi:MAG: trypsin-like serine protease [Verrucomicrobia bacterium]|nr:MAG: trypsin-like serine protease [Verrucomicrobiota bacterium]